MSASNCFQNVTLNLHRNTGAAGTPKDGKGKNKPDEANEKVQALLKLIFAVWINFGSKVGGIFEVSQLLYEMVLA